MTVSVPAEQMFLFAIDPPPPILPASPRSLATGKSKTSSSVSSGSAVSRGKTAKATSAVTPVAAKTSAAKNLPGETPSVSSSQSSSSPLASSRPNLDQLRAQVKRIESRGRVVDASEPTYSAGGRVLNQLLPHGGLRRGTINQWVDGGGASMLAMIAAAEIAQSDLSGGKPLVIVDFHQTFYPPAAIALGLPADRMVVITKQPQHSHADMIWALDQALRCEAVAAVWAELDARLDDRDARRLQLAAETGGTVGLWVRPAKVRRQPSFADTSWYVAPASALAHSASVIPVSTSPASTGPANNRRADSDRQALLATASSSRHLRVEVDRCRGGVEGAVAMVEINPHRQADHAEMTTERVVASRVYGLPSKVSASASEVHHESTVVSDLARRLADPTLAKRASVERERRRQRHAS